MGAGITTFGQIRDAKRRETGRYKTRNDFLHAIGEIVQQSIVDMMILSVPTSRRQSPRRYSRAARLRSRRRRTTRQTSGLIFGTEPMPNNLLVRYCPRLSSMFSTALLKCKSPKLAAVALANKMTRIAWKLMVTGQNLRREICARCGGRRSLEIS